MKKKRFEFKYYKEVFAVAAVIFGILALYYTFIPEECGNFECFQTEMKKCSPAKYINEESEASWEYWIRGVEGNKCAVKVTLLGAKEGDLGLREYEGNSMTCFYDEGVIAYPEKDTKVCHGLLKENLQTVVIDKLYSYIVVNLEEIREEILF